ncbi:GPALPP motifs-containing protein 1 [Aspergillus puulaauensis]|uniref:DUF3752 domain-containing protein n=1 Tax=Aspergillus puulaauensis TaxID=1220207 RepID=A0A7R7XCP2_9EURO|nr:uncharacterized protein APUU_11819A [Aspergillus puulaauensis]BCS18991.1 hypothetical protein APUU_11819A [Aspergillus puulaauensis]
MDNSSKRKLEPSAAPEATSQDTENTADKRRKVIGPSLPPPTSNNDSDNSDSDSDSDDDDFGPSLPPPEGSIPQAQQQPSTQSTTPPLNAEKGQEEKPAPKRDAWMLAPPTGDSDRSRVDPTKLRNRKFQSGPRAGNAPAGGGGVDSSWTETPEEKMRRLQDQAMGISVPGAGGVSSAGPGADDKTAQAMREKVQRYNERVRKDEAGSLVEEKKRKEKEKGKDGEEEEDDPSKRAFDREKDMALSSKLTHAQRREMMSKAADFGSRFSKGKFL